jgi:D-arabinitol dehydrogenase (NADP+)
MLLHVRQFQENTDICRYSGPEKFAVVQVDVPTIGDDDVLVR